MRPLLFLIVSIATSHGRLIERSTEKFPTIDIKTTNPNLPIRLARAAFDEDTLTTFSREFTGQSDEIPEHFNRRARHFVITSPKRAPEVNNSRFPRESNERLNKSFSKNASSSIILVKEKDTLVRKPIAKFSEVDYDDDFQTRMIKSPTKFLDSGEHEDEDFNLDDYDFDINHDEYAGRGKPLEPRTKTKEQHKTNNQEQQLHLLELEPALKPTIKIQSKLVIPQNDKIYSNKKYRSALKKLIPRSAMDKIKEDDYNYDETTTAKRKEKDIKQHDGDDYGEENEESRENEQKSVRTARSAWNMSTYVDKLGETTTTIMSKVLSVLPMFPQLPRNKKEYTSHLSGKLDPSVDNIVKFNHISF